MVSYYMYVCSLKFKFKNNTCIHFYCLIDFKIINYSLSTKETLQFA